MRHRLNTIAKLVGYTILVFFLLSGLTEVLYPVKPFWLDEWFIIQNIKFRTPQALWGQLEYMQQFPRVYLQIIRQVGEWFNFSYASLRSSSFVVHALAVIFCLRLSRQLFGSSWGTVFLWVAMYMSFKTSLHYFVQVKQYTMEMFMGLVAIWQLKSLIKLRDAKLPPLHLVILYCSFAFATFFSYTYPIVAAPVFIIVWSRWLMAENKSDKTVIHLVLTTIISVSSIVLFYWLDVKQVLQDQGMQDYWKEFTTKEGFEFKLVLRNIYLFFAHIGSGGLFEVIFGITGIAGWLYGLGIFKRNIKGSLVEQIYAYATLVVTMAIVLYVAGKLPMGIHRLNAFATPALGLLTINLLMVLGKYKKGMPVVWLSLVLMLALSGNIVSTIITERTSDEHNKKLAIYNNVTEAVAAASKANIPIAVTRDITYPHDTHEEVTGDWVVETYPAYDKQQQLPVFSVNNNEEAIAVMRSAGFSSIVYISASGYEVMHLN